MSVSFDNEIFKMGENNDLHGPLVISPAKPFRVVRTFPGLYGVSEISGGWGGEMNASLACWIHDTTWTDYSDLVNVNKYLKELRDKIATHGKLSVWCSQGSGGSIELAIQDFDKATFLGYEVLTPRGRQFPEPVFSQDEDNPVNGWVVQVRLNFAVLEDQ